MRPPLARYPTPAACHLGWGAADAVGTDARTIGATHALLVVSPHLRGSDMTRQAEARLQEAGVDATRFSGARHAADEDAAAEGARRFLEAGCDALVSVGGASAHDLAKAIGAGASSGGPVRELARPGAIRRSNPPHVALNTTAGSGTEVTGRCVLLSRREDGPLVLDDAHLTPRIAINDPAVHRSMPPKLTAASGMNALTHAVEAYLSRDATPFTNSLALDAVALIRTHLPRAVRDGRDEVARTAMAQAEQLSALASHGAGLGLADAMCLSLCSRYDVAHAECNAILLPYVLAHEEAAAPGRLAHLAATLADDEPADASAAARLVRALADRVGIPRSLAEAGVETDGAYTCAALALELPFSRLDRGRRTLGDVGLILTEALQGTPPEEAAAVFAAAR